MHSKILLLVDDDDGVREALRSVIEFLYEAHVHRGALDVLTAADGEEAVATCRSHLPALILMDVNMPGMDGIEAFYAIRDLRPDTPVSTVFLTGHAGSGGVRLRLEQAIEDGAHGYIFKPVMAADLKKTIDQLLHFDDVDDQVRPDDAA